MRLETLHRSRAYRVNKTKKTTLPVLKNNIKLSGAIFTTKKRSTPLRTNSNKPKETNGNNPKTITQTAFTLYAICNAFNGSLAGSNDSESDVLTETSSGVTVVDSIEISFDRVTKLFNDFEFCEFQY